MFFQRRTVGGAGGGCAVLLPCIGRPQLSWDGRPSPDVVGPSRLPGRPGLPTVALRQASEGIKICY